MRFYEKILPKLREGDFRVVRRFAWTPVTFVNQQKVKETRWLEFYKVLEKFHRHLDLKNLTRWQQLFNTPQEHYWRPISFMDDSFPEGRLTQQDISDINKRLKEKKDEQA